MKPVIGLTMHEEEQKIGLNSTYVQAILDAGGIPLCIPNIHDEDAAAVIGLVDGLLLIGGQDLDPSLYGEAPHEKLGSVHRKRDEVELALLNEAINRNIPILGICRGHQLLNVYFGGTLYQDIPTQIEDAHGHVQLSKRSELHHQVVATHPQFIALFGEQPFMVNSFHHQAVKKIGHGLEVAATSLDGVIEGLVHESAYYCVSVQWHPEELTSKELSAANTLFLDFIQMSQNKL